MNSRRSLRFQRVQLFLRPVCCLAPQYNSLLLIYNRCRCATLINIMMVLSPREIRLEEFRRRFDARFINRFEAVGQGTRYSIVADVQLKGMARAGSSGPSDRARAVEQIRARADAGCCRQRVAKATGRAS